MDLIQITQLIQTSLFLLSIRNAGILGVNFSESFQFHVFQVLATGLNCLMNLECSEFCLLSIRRELDQELERKIQ